MLFGSHSAVYTASICATVSLMATVIVLPIVHTQFQRKLSLMLSNAELCRVCEHWRARAASNTRAPFAVGVARHLEAYGVRAAGATSRRRS